MVPPTTGNAPRDVPILYPTYFTELLTTSGTPLAHTNIARLVERTAIMIGGQAAAYCAQSRDADAFEAFVRTFARGGHRERRLHLVDDIVDWLWAWNAGCHDDLRSRFSKWRNGLLQPGGLLADGGDIAAFSEDEENPQYEHLWRTVYAKNLPPDFASPSTDSPSADDIGQIISGGLRPVERLRLFKKLSSNVWVRGRDMSNLAERGAELLNGSIARLPVRDLDSLHRAYGADHEVAVDKLIDSAADQAGWLWAATAALPVPPPAAHALKVILHSMIELRLIAELYTIYGQQNGARDATWLNTVVHAWAVGHPVATGPAVAVGVREIAARLQAAYTGLVSDHSRMTRLVHRGRDGRDLIRGTGSRFRRRMRYHPSTWPQPQDLSTVKMVAGLVTGAVRSKVGLDDEVDGRPPQHLDQAWSQHLRARSATAAIIADSANQPMLIRLHTALDAQQQRLDWLANRMGIKSPKTTAAMPTNSGRQPNPISEAHSAAELAEQAIDRTETTGTQPRRLAGWPAMARNSLVYLIVSLFLGAASAWLLAANLTGESPGLGTVALLTLPLCGVSVLAYGIGVAAVGRLFRPWLNGPTARSPIIGLLITLAVTLLVPAITVSAFR